MKNTEIAKILQDIGDLLELRGENVFKVRAYQRAARAVEHLPREIEFMVKEGEDLRDIPGVGEALAKKIGELVTTGRLEYYEKLRADFPEGISNLLDVPGVGPRTAMRLSSELGVKTVDDLDRAIQEGKVARLSHMGEKTAENIHHAIQALRRKDERIPIGEALPLVEDIVAALRTMPGVRNLTPAGSLRRFRETIGDIDIMGTADDPQKVIEAFTALPQVKDVLARGTTKASVIVAGGLQVDLRLVEHERFGSLLQYFTGSKQHNIALRDRFSRRGLKISEYGITDEATGKEFLFPTEEAFYSYLGLQYIPPEMREDSGEIEMAEQGKLPRLIKLSDIKGDLHVHSKASDGRGSIEEMVLAARDLGYEYLAITDHSVGRGIAHGLNQQQFQLQMEEIRGVNGKIAGIRVLCGVEMDIRADGSLDLPDELLAQFDIVVASIHSAMGQEEDKMTRRIISAMESRHVDILAHPTCRLLGEREPVAADWEAIFRAAARTGTALEIDAMPSRLDLKDTHIRRARELGARLVMSTDAHNTGQLGFMRFGVGIARRGWCQAGDVLNTRPLAEFLAYVQRE